jgi:hypothetical protein
MSGNDFLWHHVSEEEKKKIQEQAKAVMDSFSKKLSKVEKDVKDIEVGVDRDKGEREEGSVGVDEIDKKIMFDNASNKNEDFIIAERKGW